MNEPNPILIYLAGPIDEVSTEDARSWRETVAERVPTGVVLFSPAHAYFNVSRANAPAVDTANRYQMKAADGMLAYLPEGSRGFGTIREIEFARMLGRSVVVVGSIRSLLAHDLEISEDLDRGIDALLAAIQEGREIPPFPFGLMLQGPPGHDD